MTDNGSIDPLAGLREMFAGEAEVIDLTPGAELPGTGVGGDGRMPQGHPCGDGTRCIHRPAGIDIVTHAGADYRPNDPVTLYEVNHATCPPSSHDRSLPDDNETSEAQRVADDGLSACNDCRRPLFYCTVAGWYFHVDPHAGCFLSPAWGDEPYPW